MEPFSSQEIVHSSAQTAISRPSQQSAQRDEIENLLVLLAEARQASVSPETLKLYSSDLAKYGIDDIRAAVGHLSHLRRKEGETAFPDLAMLDDAVYDAKNARLRAEREARAKDAMDALIRDQREHPENYFGLKELLAEFAARRGMTAEPKPIPRKGMCEHCNGVQLSALTPADLRALADALEGRNGNL